jgi:uncharacterized surface anchored protein/protocatechuate 3,4-dioxygenase beta subunit
MKDKMKRTLALFLTMLMILTSNSSIATVFAAEGDGGTETTAEETLNTESTEEETAAPTPTATATPTPEATPTPAATATPTPEATPTATATPEPAEAAETTPAPETTPAESSASTPAAQTQSSAAGNSAQTREGERIFKFEASINEQGTREAEVQAGDTFSYILGYNVPPLASGENFTSLTISISLGGELSKRLSLMEDETGVGGYAVQGEGVQAVTYRSNTGQLDIKLSQALQPGQGHRITIRFQTDNFEWEDGSVIQLDPVLTGSTSQGQPVTGSLVEGSEAKVTVTASDGWKVEKSVGTVTSDEEYYYVPYTVELINTDSSGKEMDVDRLGRLNLADGTGIVIRDVLPEADTGNENDEGQHIGYPVNGAPAEIVDVKMSDGAGGTVSLTEGTDYTYTAGGTDIVFSRTATASEDGAYIHKGTPVNTTYTYTVKYPKMPYLSPANVSEAEKYWLQNTADLTYTLLGQEEKKDSDTAEIVLGEKSEAAGFCNLTVQKRIEIGGKEYGYSKEKYGTVSFALYSDEDCKEIANNYIGTVPAGAEQEVNDSGQVTFYQLAPGTYYLKETHKGSGLSNADDVVKIILTEDNQVQVGDDEKTAEVSGTAVHVINTADAYGNVEFYKYGKNAEGEKKALPGATFTLTSADGQVYTAVSGSDGRVFFEGIPAGKYTLKETAVPDEEYQVSDAEISVTVEGNATVHPEGLPNADQISDVNGAPVFENVSSKGKFQFKKVDSKDTDKILEGAEFRLYGPFTEEQTTIPENEQPVTDGGQEYILTSEDGIAISIALEQGWYLMEEIQAPDGYAVKGSGLTPVKVIANEINQEVYSIENDELVKLTFNKVGAIQASGGGTAYTEQLAGAVFEIYDVYDEDAEPVATVETYLDGANHSVSGIRQEDGTFEDLYLAPGTYYYKEIKAPEGYEITNENLQRIELTEDTEQRVENRSDFGQIMLTKVDGADAEKKLSGAVFGIYTDEACETPLMDGEDQVTLTTDENGVGIATVPTVPEGKTTYWLKELEAPAGYVLSDQILSVEVGKDHRVEVNNGTPVTNDQARSIIITKKDSKTGTVLSGAQFELYGPYDGNDLTEEEKSELNPTDNADKYAGASTPGENGAYTFSGLEAGKWYYVKETAAPSGYVLSTEVLAVQTTGSADKELQVTKDYPNDRLGKIVISKTTDMDAADGSGEPLDGVTFTLYRAKQVQNGDGTTSWEQDGNAVRSGTTANGGALHFDGLEPGDYLLVETTPDGHDAADPVHVTVRAGMNQGTGYVKETETIKNTANKGKLELDKISSTDETKHIKATFDIFKDNGSGQPGGDRVGTISTTGSATDHAVSGWLEPGEYVLVETEVENGYVLDPEPVRFTVEEAKTTSLTGEDAVKNDPLGQITFSKKAFFNIQNSETGETVKYDLTGAELRLYKKTCEDAAADITAGNYNAPVRTVDMRSSASATVSGLEPGDYWIVESVFPEGYSADPETSKELTLTVEGEEIRVTVVADCTIQPGQSADTTVTIDNYTKNGKLQIQKLGWDYTDEEQTDWRPMNTAEFEVYRQVKAGTEGAVQTPDGNWAVLVENASASTDQGGRVMVSGTHGEGLALSVDLEPGIYYIRELLDPEDELYWADVEKPEDAWANTNWYPLGGEWSEAFTITEGEQTNVEFKNYRIALPGHKTVKGSQKTLDGAVFAAFDSLTDADNFQGQKLRAENISIDEENRAALLAELENWETSEELAQYKIADVSTISGVDGAFEFRNLEPGETYYIVEAIAPEGYALADKIFTLTVAENGNGFVTGNGEPYVFTVADEPLGQISVKKITELNGAQYTVAGIRFNIYEAKTDENGDYEYEDAEGKVTKYAKASDTPIAYGTTQADGIYSSILLEAGIYIIEEDVNSIADDSIVKEPDETPYKVIVLDSGDIKTDGSDATFENPARYGKFVLKKVDQDSNPIAASFRLEKWDDTAQAWKQIGEENEAGEPAEMIITTSAGGNGIYESDFLETGTYRLVETAADGYSVAYGEDNAVEFTIESGKITGSKDTEVEPGEKPTITTEGITLNDPILLANNQKGSLKLLKVGMYQGKVYDSALAGVQFSLYKDADGEELVSTETTGSDGTCSWTGLDAGDYWLKETGIAEGSEADGKYELTDPAAKTARKVTVEPGENVVLDDADGEDARFENSTTYGQFKVQKVDANDPDRALAGAKFEIYTDEACTAKAVTMDGSAPEFETGEDGTGISPMLPEGTYYLKEVEEPDGYSLDAENGITGPYKVVKNTVTDETDEPITNTKLFSIVVIKKETGTDTVLAGATIGLYNSLENAKKAGEDGLIESVVTGKDGKAEFDGLRFEKTEKSYFVTEIQAPSGYDRNVAVYEVKVAYDADKTEFTFENGDKDGIIENDRLGTITIRKQGTWQDIDDTSEANIDLSGVIFTLYKVDGCGETHAADAEAAATLVTENGTVKSPGLAAGWYELVETGVPEGFSEQRTESYWVYIANNKDSETLYKADETKKEDNLIMNYPDQGRFTLFKYDGAEGKSGLTPLSGAVFKLEKAVGNGWQASDPETFTMVGTSYTSGYLDPGTYRITEVTAPTYKYTENNVEKTIRFSLLDEPIEFEITAGKTEKLDAYNSPTGSITLTKYGVDGDGTTKAVLSGATFALFSDENGQNMIQGTEKTTDADGKIVWENLKHGTYYVKETDTNEKKVNDQGYAITDEIEEVTIEPGALVQDIIKNKVLDKTVEFDDPSNAGKIRILKTNKDGSVMLSGAEFEIYAKDGSGWSDEPVEKLTITDAEKGAVSGFLPADENGTEYKIVETKAPGGYTLDESLSELEQVVTVYPYHTPAAAEDAKKNCFVFANAKDDSMAGMNGQIHKQIREAGDGDDETEFTEDTVTADESLLISDYTVEFKLDGYADGSNEKPIHDLTVTDNDIRLQWLEQVNSGSTAYRDLEAGDGDYTINSVTVNASSNTENTEEKVGAVIYVQSSQAEKAAGSWKEVKTLEDLSQVQTVAFSDPVIGVKVVYTHTLEKFSSDGLILNVTFANRGATSTEEDHEVRRIINQADISWKDTYLDNTGTEKERAYDLDSNEVMAEIPTYEIQLPEIQITTEITDTTQTFYSGDEINFRVTAANMSPEEDAEKILRQPVLSFKLPAHTTLDETQWTAGFLVKKISADGTEVVIPSTLYRITETETIAAEGYNGGDSYDEAHQYPTTQYAVEFADSVLTQLKPGERIEIEFTGLISYEEKTGFDLVIPAYLSSTAKIPKSAENPLGLSFLPYENAVLYDNEVTDELLGDELNYVNDTDSRFVTNTTAVRLQKEIGVKNEDGTIEWLSRGEVASIHPSEEVYYRLTLFNYSDRHIETAKIVDIFPCENDTYVISREDRGTDIPFGEGYEDIELISVEDVTGTGTVTWYSTDHNWSVRSDEEEDGILQPMYHQKSDWSMGWTEMNGIDSDATAIGMEIDFTNGGTSDGLEQSGTYQIIISMKTPGYTADQISEYYGRFMDNSAAASVVKQGTSDQLEDIPLEDMVEPNKVRATMELPTGTIGDYVWYDADRDGIQDEEEEPVQGMKVTLWQTRYYEFNGSLRQESKIFAQTVTDQDGKYLFTGLPCQYLNSGAQEGSTDPNDYVGGEYYTYQVRFEREGEFAEYTFTQQYAEKDKDGKPVTDSPVDSDASASGETGQISLEVLDGENGMLVGEENLTLDAGLVEAYSLGDYVWLDTNGNGVQDPDEQGVEGVPVFLYRVDGPDGSVEDGQAYEARVTTDADGYYTFDDLREGYYVVEFDISNLRKTDGYTYRYDFTVCQDGAAGISGTDSDARHDVDEDGRIRRTDVITLTKETLEAQGIMNRRDDRWDAGLVVYSAIGGFIFDDADYDDLQSIYIPLEGTLVELYEVNPDGSLSAQPVASQTVGADGEYYFDHLTYGTEYKDYSVKFTWPEGYYGVEANADGDGATDDPKVDSDRDSDVNRFDQAADGSGADRTYGWISRIRLPQDTVTVTWDAGARKYSAIGDYVWIDEDQDGLQDEGEAPVPDVPVVLQSRADSGSEWEYAAYTKTDENGKYWFSRLESSEYLTKEYRVVFVLPENTHITALNSGTDRAVDSDAIGAYMADIVPVVARGQNSTGGFVTASIKPGYGEEDPTWDAGILQLLGAVGDYVWLDEDHNGIQDEDETGVAGVPVVLEWNSAGNTRDEEAWTEIGRMVTDKDGKYLFEGLEAGYYRVKFQIPEEYVNTRYNRGTGENGNEIDSDASRSAGDRWYYSSSFYLSEGQIDLTWDAGIYKPITRTEIITHREPHERVNRVQVVRTRRPSTTRGTRGSRTGDNTVTTPYIILGIIGVGGCIALGTAYKKKKRRDA